MRCVRDRRFYHRFIIGTAALEAEKVAELNTEQLMHGDLAFLPAFHESYAALAAKLRDSLVLATTALPPFRFLLKVHGAKGESLQKRVEACRGYLEM